MSSWAVVLTAVLVHPTGIHRPDGARNWARTVEHHVDYRSGPVAGVLSDEDRAALEELHPDGTAQFWGTPAHNAHFMERVQPGDVVFLTGRRRGARSRAQVLGIGRIGLLTRNPRLGDLLWPPSGDAPRYAYVYSLAPFAPSELSQEELATRGGQGPKPPFLGLRVLSDELTTHVLEVFSAEIPAPRQSVGRSPGEREFEEVLQYDTADAALAADLAHVRVVSVEARSVGPAQVRAREPGAMRRGENLLVYDYIATLPSGVTVGRYITPNGVTDLDLWRDGRHELLEAKSSASRTYVRQALAQLLDYASALEGDPPEILTALFPEPPADSALELLNRYGVDCLYRDGGPYVRVPAPADRRDAVRGLWRERVRR